MKNPQRIGDTQKELIALMRESGNAINTYSAQTQVANYAAGYVSVVSRALWRLCNRHIVKREDATDLTKREQITLNNYVKSHPQASAIWVLAEKFHV